MEHDKSMELNPLVERSFSLILQSLPSIVITIFNVLDACSYGQHARLIKKFRTYARAKNVN